MLVTVNTDASYLSIQKIGGFAVWIVCDKGRYKFSGPTKDAESSIDCEIKAIGNALHVLSKVSFVREISRIHINTDCKEAIKHIRGKSNYSVSSRVHDLAHLVRKNSASSNKSLTNFLTFKHVKAHSDKEDARSWVNDWCDKEAKKESIKQLRNL